MMQNIIYEDMEYILNDKCIPWDKLKNAKVLVTGATGLIGSTLVKALLFANEHIALSADVWCLVRNTRKAEDILGTENDRLHFLSGDVLSALPSDVSFDYVIHGASPTASAFFIEHPAETIETAVLGTQNLLSKAKKDGAKGFLYLSSMEAYGNVSDERVLEESDHGRIDLSNVRSCYPEGKRMCELLCKSYASEFGLRAMSIRLAQTFGAGVLKEDKRVFAMMARCAVNGEDIVLMTKGTSKHPYLYTAQAVTAILCVLLCGEAGETYNAANPETYCSIYEMGELVAKEIADGRISVRIQENKENVKFPPAGFLNLSVDKICGLGWKPQGTLADMYRRMISYMEN